MDKYAIPIDLVKELLELKACETEEEAIEKVASGEAPCIIKEAKLRHINDFMDTARMLFESGGIEYKVDLAEEAGIDIAKEVSKLKSSSEE
jgi:hypothetical protein